jgi:hypothetical protein
MQDPHSSCAGNPAGLDELASVAVHEHLPGLVQGHPEGPGQLEWLGSGGCPGCLGIRPWGRQAVARAFGGGGRFLGRSRLPVLEPLPDEVAPWRGWRASLEALGEVGVGGRAKGRPEGVGG